MAYIYTHFRTFTRGFMPLLPDRLDYTQALYVGTRDDSEIVICVTENEVCWMKFETTISLTTKCYCQIAMTISYYDM